MGFVRGFESERESAQLPPEAPAARAARGLVGRSLRVVLLCATCLFPVSAAAQVNWEYSPYSIKVWVAFGYSPELTDRLLEQIAETVAQRAYVVAGSTWDVETVPCPDTLRSAVATDVESVTTEAVEAAARSVLKKDDKLFLLGVRAEMTRFVITVRELDCRSRVWRPILTRYVIQPDRIPREAFAALADAFSPLVRIEVPKGKSAQVRMRAGGLITSDSLPTQIHDRDVLLPIIRRNDRLGEPEEDGIVVIPWTFLTITEREGSVLQCQVHSFMPSALGGRSSSRTVKLALVAKPRGETTFLRLETRDELRLPLGGYEIHAKDPVTENSELIGTTDWRGMLEVPKAEHPLRVLYVRNGGQLLARLPMVPGLEAESTAQVRNDDVRLEAEGFVKGLQTRVMDLVARRHLYAARFKRDLDKKEFDKAKKLLEEYRTLETRSDLFRLLRDEEQRTTSPDKRVQAKIDRLFKDMGQLLSKFLDPDAARDLQAKLDAAQTGGG